ncbi:MAG: endonuclease/exonuclease/phosphatase family protein [Halolamina sp.]
MSARPWLRALSLNLRLDRASDGDDAWPARREQVVGCVRVHRPDCLALQEALPEQLAFLRRSLPEYEFHAVGRRADGGGERVPVGWRTDRFEAVGTDAFWLSPTPDEPGSRFPEAAHPRVTTAVTLRDRDSENGDAVRLVSTHFDHEAASARARSAALLADRLADADRPTLLLGDLNCEPGEEPYRRLAAALTPARAAADRTYGPTATFHDFTGEPTVAIDHGFVAGFPVSTFAALPDRNEDGYPSDHFPVVVDVEKPE